MKVKSCINPQRWGGATIDLDFPRIYVWDCNDIKGLNVTKSRESVWHQGYRCEIKGIGVQSRVSVWNQGYQCEIKGISVKSMVSVWNQGYRCEIKVISVKSRVSVWNQGYQCEIMGSGVKSRLSVWNQGYRCEIKVISVKWKYTSFNGGSTEPHRELKTIYFQILKITCLEVFYPVQSKTKKQIFVNYVGQQCSVLYIYYMKY